MNHGLILVPHSDDGFFRWAMGDANSLLGSGRADTVGALPRALMDQDDLVVVLPGEHAATRLLRLPVKGDRALADAAALAFEDILSDGVDDYHFAFGPPDENGMRLVSAMPRDVFAAHLEAFTDAGVEPDRVTVDHLALRRLGDSAIALFIGDRVIAALPGGGISGGAASLAPLVVQLADGVPIRIVEAECTHNDKQPADLTLADDRAIGSFFIAGVGDLANPNFRRGIFSKQRNWLQLAQGWRQAGILMAACFVLWIADSVVDATKHSRAAERLYDQASATFSAAFPGSPIRDLRRQALQRQAVVRGSAFIGLTTVLTRRLEDSVALKLTGIRYTENGELIADLSFPDFSALEQLKAKLEADGIRIREGGNNPLADNGDYVGQLILEAEL